MSLVRRTLLLVPLVVLVSLPCRVSAQEIASSFEQLQSHVKSGETILVRGTNGRTTRGKLGELSSAALQILVRETGTDGRDVFKPRPLLSEKDVEEIEIEQSDSLLNGTLIGLAAGGWPWLMCLNDCVYGEPGAESLLPTIFGFTTAIGVGLGVLIDHSIKDHVTVFISRERRATLRVSPLVSRSAAGFRVSLGF